MGLSAARGPSEGVAARGRERTVADLLRNSRFEVLPLDGIEDEVRTHPPIDMKVTVTASPRKGLEATFDLSERLALKTEPRGTSDARPTPESC